MSLPAGGESHHPVWASSFLQRANGVIAIYSPQRKSYTVFAYDLAKFCQSS